MYSHHRAHFAHRLEISFIYLDDEPEVSCASLIVAIYKQAIFASTHRYAALSARVRDTGLLRFYAVRRTSPSNIITLITPLHTTQCKGFLIRKDRLYLRRFIGPAY